MTNITQFARSLKVDRWPLVGPPLRAAGRLLNANFHREKGVRALIDGQVSLKLSPFAFSGGNYAFDPLLTNELKRIAQSGRGLLDAGAHVGLASLLYRYFAGPETRILAFEPNPNVFPLLCENNRVSGMSIEAYRIALGDRTGMTKFFVSGNDANASLSQEAPGKYWYWRDKEKPVMQTCTCPITTIDSICSALGFDPGLIKLDVEGAEFPVLSGASKTLDRVRPKILLETHVFAWESFGYSGKDLEGFLASHRYEVRDANGEAFTGSLGEGPGKDNNHYLLIPR